MRSDVALALSLNRVMALGIGNSAFHEVEVLDLARPYGVATTASRVAASLAAGAGDALQVATLWAEPGLVRTRTGLQFQIDYVISQAPSLGVLIVPCGMVDA